MHDLCPTAGAGYLLVTTLLILSAMSNCTAGQDKPENIARRATIVVSSTSEGLLKENAVDGKMDTAWGAAGGLIGGHWFELHWDQPQKVSGIVLYQTGLHVQQVEVQADQDGKWVSVAYAGVSYNQLPMVIAIPLKPQTTKALRLNCSMGCAFYEVEVYEEPALAQEIHDRMSQTTIAVAGDLIGHLIGTVSQAEGTVPIASASVDVSGQTPGGPWQRSATTDGNGYFSVDMPPASVGAIKVVAAKSETKAYLTVDSGDIAKRLTPRPAEGHNNRVSLEGKWDFAPDPPKDFLTTTAGLRWSPTTVPSHWEMEGFVCDSGLYRRAFTIPKDWAGKRIKLRAESIYSHCEIWVNGKRTGSHEGGTTAFELDVSDAARPGKNEILILVQCLSKAADFDRLTYLSYFNIAGIWRPLEVFCVEPTHVSRIAYVTTFDQGYKDAELSVDVDVSNEQSKAVTDQQLRLRLFDPRGAELALEGLSSPLSLSPWETRAVKLKCKVAAPRQWNAEKPELYKLVAEVVGPGTRAAVEQPVGFRQIEIKGRRFLLNGRLVKFLGVSKLDAHPLGGRVLTDEVNRRDIEMMKQANFNSLRISAYPSHPLTMDLTDQQGLYVKDDGPFDFVWDGKYSNDLRNAPFMISQMSEHVERDRNHPSVTIWSICNESAFGRGFQMAYEFVRGSDPTRPCSTGQSGNLEVATYHCPASLKKIEDTANLTMPVLNDESFPIFHGWGGLAASLELDPGLRDYWCTGIPEVIDAIRKCDYFMGALQFSWVDDTFLVPNKGIQYWRNFGPPIHFADSVYRLPRRGIVGDYIWGTVDGWRRPRPEWWLSKKLFSPIRIAESPIALPQSGGAISIPVENLNSFINLDEYLCRWSVGKDKGETRVSVAAESRGTLVVTPKNRPGADDVLNVEFYDSRGRLIDGYKLPFKAHEVPSLPKSGKPARIVDQPPDVYLQWSHPIRLLGEDAELSYDRNTGQMMWCLAGREPVLLSGPTLHMILHPTSDPLPDPRAWKLTGSSYKTLDGRAVISWDGQYGEQFVGGFEIGMDDAGNTEMTYSFTYKGTAPIQAREIGVGFELPTGMDRLEWDRKSEYSYYPEDHIGRPHGVAMVHSKAAQTVPPGDRPYSQDDHPWGCNDFRSAKRHIYWASLTNSEGAGVKVISDGGDTVRATMGATTLGLKVLGHYDGSPAEINEYAGLYGPGRTIKPGEVISGVVKLQLLPGSVKALPGDLSAGTMAGASCGAQ